MENFAAILAILIMLGLILYFGKQAGYFDHRGGGGFGGSGCGSSCGGGGCGGGCGGGG